MGSAAWEAPSANRCFHRSNAYTQPRAGLDIPRWRMFSQLFLCKSLLMYMFSKIKWHFHVLNSPYNLIFGHPVPVPHPSFLKPNQPPTQTSKLRVLISSPSWVLEESSPLTLISWRIAQVPVAYWEWGGSGSPPLQRYIHHRIACPLPNSLSRHWFWARQSQYKKLNEGDILFLLMCLLRSRVKHHLLVFRMKMSPWSDVISYL